MTSDELRQLLELGHEQSGVEFKGAHPRNDRVFGAKIVRAALGMANRRNGGLIVLGIDELPSGLSPVGLSNADAATWRHDLLADLLAQHAEPPVNFTTEVVHLDGKLFVVIGVAEFLDVPVLCRRAFASSDGTVILREGACYVRPRRKPETTEVPTYADMRDLLHLAVQKNVRRFVEAASATGASTVFSSELSDAAQFANQRQELE